MSTPEGLSQIERLRYERDTLASALSAIKSRDSHIDATARGSRQVVMGDFARIADAALTRAANSERKV